MHSGDQLAGNIISTNQALRSYGWRLWAAGPGAGAGPRRRPPSRMILNHAVRPWPALLLAALFAAGPCGAPRAAEPEPQVESGETPAERLPAEPEATSEAKPDEEPGGQPGDEQKKKKKKKSDWKFTIGAVGGIRPRWQGSNSYKFAYAPEYGVSWRNRVFLKNESLGVNAIKTKELRAGVQVRRVQGRSDNARDLDGVDGVDRSFEVGGFLRYDHGALRLHLEVHHDVASGHEGTVGLVAASTKVTLAKVLTFRARAEVTAADGNYMGAFFGVDRESAANSGLDRYDADAGLRDVGLILTTGYKITKNWRLGLKLSYRRLLSEAADSPIVRKRGSPNQYRAGLGLTFNF